MPDRVSTAEAPTEAATAAAALYFGAVMHARLKPMSHRFSYRVMSLLLDLDRLGEADRQTPLFARATTARATAPHCAPTRRPAPPSMASISAAAACNC
jgi:hypothetical protein